SKAQALGVSPALTGPDKGDGNVAVGAGANDYPAIGSVLGMVRPPRAPVPPYVSLPYITQEGAGGPPQPGFFGGVLGRTRDPLFVLRDPNAANFGMPELATNVEQARLRSRRDLLGKLPDGTGGKAGELTGFQGRAFDLLSSQPTP